MSDQNPTRPTKLLAEDSAGVPSVPPDYPGPRSVSSAVVGGRVTSWRALTDERAADEWRALRYWVEWFTIRYDIPLSTVPTCWWRHGLLVEELSALHASHRAAFDPTDTGNGPIGWHEHLTLAVARMHRAYAGGCSDGHRSLPSRTWAGATDEGEWDAWISQSHAHRDAAASPIRKEAR